jgi:hypothetical protein
VQASHAALEAGFQFQAPPNVASIVLLGVKNQEELTEATHHLERKGISYHLFYEPDFPKGFTALATSPISDPKLRRIFQKFELWRA